MSESRSAGSVIARLRSSSYHLHLLKGSSAVVVSLGFIAAGGGLFWLVAARTIPDAVVGRTAALFSLVAFCVYLTNMGAPIAVGRYAPSRSSDDRARFCLAALYMASAAIAGSWVVFAVANATTDLFDGLAAAPALAITTVAVVGLCFSALVDVRLIALRQWSWVMVRTGTVALVRLPIVLLLPGSNQIAWLFLAATMPDALSGLIGAATLGRGGIKGMRASGSLPALRPAFRFANVQYVSQLTIQAPMILIPVVVLLQVSPTQNAAFYVAWNIAMFGFIVPEAIARVLLTEGGKDGAPLIGQVRFALAMAVSLMVLITLAVTVGAGLVTMIYGEAYALAADNLPWLMAAGVAWAVSSVLICRARVEELAARTLAVTTIFATVCVIPSIWLVGAFGVAGASIAWLTGNLVTAVAAVLLIGRRRAHAQARPVEVEDLPVLTMLGASLEADTVGITA